MVIDTLTLALLARQFPTVGITRRKASTTFTTYYHLSTCARCVSMMPANTPVGVELLPWPHPETPPGPAHRHCSECRCKLIPTLEHLPCVPSP